MREFYIGIDVGSTTVKIVCLDEKDNIIYSIYQRHLSNVRETTKKIFDEFLEYIKNNFGEDIRYKINITGSSGMGISSWIGIVLFTLITYLIDLLLKKM